jgi:hypothetical protein
MNEVILWKWWWGWDCRPIEDWLEGMEAQGLRLERVGCGGLRFTFRSGLPGHARYCVDYYPRPGAGWFELLAANRLLRRKRQLRDR